MVDRESVAQEEAKGIVYNKKVCFYVQHQKKQRDVNKMDINIHIWSEETATKKNDWLTKMILKSV